LIIRVGCREGGSKMPNRLTVLGRCIPVMVILVSQTALAAGTGWTADEAATPCPSVWTVVPSPNVGSFTNELSGTAAVSSTDVWAVGDYSTDVFGSYLTLVEHWDGTSWTVTPSPNVGGATNALRAAVAVSANDVWAVGWAWNATDFAFHTLIEHWTGSSWSVVPSPNASTGTNALYDVTATSSSDIWATGYYQINGGSPLTLAEHWNGSTWSVFPTPNRSGAGHLFGGFALTSSNAWAVGDGGGTLAEQWNGSVWNVIPTQNVGDWANTLDAISATGTSDMWAVGSYQTGGTSPYDKTLVEEWDGTAWTISPSPSPGSYRNELAATVALGPTDVWAAGLISVDTVTSSTLTEHWDGLAWTVVASPNVADNNQLLDMSSAEGIVWTVGRAGQTGDWTTLIEELCPVAPPTISSFVPNRGPVGKPVRITGTGFTGATSVQFGGVSSNFTVDSDAQISTSVPNGAITGTISVTTPGGTATSSSVFSVSPTLRGFRPASGPVGTVVTLKGSALTGATKVTFNGASASFVVVSYSRIRATVPAGATSGPIVVTTPGGRDKSKTSFIVT
jgi:hypothetical protein